MYFRVSNWQSFSLIPAYQSIRFYAWLDLETKCWDIFLEEFIQICLSSIMRLQFSALVTGEIFVGAFGHLFLFTIVDDLSLASH